MDNKKKETIFELYNLSEWKEHSEAMIESTKFNIGHIFYCNDFHKIYCQFQTFVEKFGLEIYLNGIKVDIEVLDVVVKSLLEYEKSKQSILKSSQLEGIKVALIKKYEGNGNYGRPKVALPPDFEEQVRKCLLDNRPLESYRRKIQMKKSTFYKYSKYYI